MESSEFSPTGFFDVTFIAKGAFGSVFQAKHKNHPKKLFAVKQMTASDEEDHLKIEKEIRNLQTLNVLNPKPKAIPIFYGFYKEGLANNCYNLIFDFFPKSLLDVKSNKRFPFQVLIQIFESIVNSLAFLQTLGICHRDLKPGNLLFNEENKQIYLIDFRESKENNRGSRKNQKRTHNSRISFIFL